MISYNAKWLQSQLTSLSVLTKTNICIMDDKNYYTEAKNVNLKVHFCRFMSDCFLNKCKESDLRGLEIVKQNGGAIYYSCHFGFIEILISYKMSDKSKMYVSVGPFRMKSDNKKDTAKIRELCDLFNKDYKKSIKLYHNIPSFTVEKFNAIKTMVDTIVEKAKLEKDIYENENFVENDFVPYVIANASSNPSVNDIAKHFNLTEKQLEKKVKSQTGLTPIKYINKTKMEAAYDDIMQTNDSLIDISYKYGFDDYNYFIKVFKEVNGKTPSNCRKQ